MPSAAYRFGRPRERPRLELHRLRVAAYTHHEGIVRGADRAERNMLRAVTGGVDKLDTETLITLNKVLLGA